MKELNKYAKLLGSKGGKQSAKSRFTGKSKEEISEMMRKVRKGKFTKSDELVDALNDSVKQKS